MTLPNGEKKYKNLDKLAKGKHVVLFEYQNELTDGIRIFDDRIARTPERIERPLKPPIAGACGWQVRRKRA